MLKSILSPKTCAACKNCCVFRPESAWEMPTFSKAAIDRLPKGYPIQPDGDRYRIMLSYGAEDAARPCPFLDSQTGCTLPPEEKPFACGIWPIRVMPDSDGKPALTLYQGCDGLPDADAPALHALLDSGLRLRILKAAEQDPTLIVPYHPNYRYL